MIVRAVLQNPELIEHFDWFNDGKDTINWLKRDPENAKLIARMEEKYNAWLGLLLARMEEKYNTKP
jgi:hypothetical protein